MRELFYRFLTLLTRVMGPWVFVLGAGVVASGYFVLFPSRTLGSMRFYRALFPGRGRFFYLWCAWRQFQSFTSVFLDRFLLQKGEGVSNSFEGREHLFEALRQGRGGVLLMTHIGNWEVGARLLRRAIPELRLMLYMGQRAKEQIERMQKEDLSESGIRIVAADAGAASPLDLMEGIGFIKSGGFVSMAGDLVWHEHQRVVAAGFLGHTVRLPEAPFMLALVAGAPLYLFFAHKKGSHRYHFKVLPPISVAAGSRSQRRAAVQQAAQAYIDQVERHLRQVPFQWYHFAPFLGPRLAADRDAAACSSPAGPGGSVRPQPDHVKNL